MCGIVGYVGKKRVVPVIIEGLRRLEYRGYDSAGIAVPGNGDVITRESAGTIYTHAGPEIGVASTKAFTAQLTALYLFALYLAQLRGAMTAEQAKDAVQNSLEFPASSSTC